LIYLPRARVAGEVLVRAHAIGVGNPDVLFRTGAYRWRLPLPATPGAEMSGTIEAFGRDVSGLRIGQAYQHKETFA
jgi:NADPH2:quinone reductase